MGYPRWKNSKGYICTGTMATCMKELKSQVTKSLPHTSTKCVQAFTTEKESVKEDPNKIVIQLDFAENYSIPLKFKMKSSQLIGHTVKSLSSQSAHGNKVALILWLLFPITSLTTNMLLNTFFTLALKKLEEFLHKSFKYVVVYRTPMEQQLSLSNDTYSAASHT